MRNAKQLYIDFMDRLQAKRELKRFKNLLNGRATSLAVQLTLTGALHPPRFSTRWRV